MMRRSTSEEVIKRLPLYLRFLNRLLEEGTETVTSKRLARELDINPALIRSDLSWFGEFGTAGVGYDARMLVEELRSILNREQKWKIVLVGVGKIGKALLGHSRIGESGLEIKLAFDSDPRLIGRQLGGVEVEDVSKMEQRVREEGIRLGIVAVPFSEAQKVAQALVSGGIKGIVNFAPRRLHLPVDVRVNSVDIVAELTNLLYYLSEEGVVQTGE